MEKARILASELGPQPQTVARDARDGGPARPSTVSTIDFRTLTRSVQERFVACARGAADPKPILVAPLRPTAPAIWAATTLFATIALVLLLARGFGDLQSGHALHTTTTLVVYGALIGVIALGLSQLAVLELRRRSLPYRRGVYVFPLSVVDARDAMIRVHSLAELLDVEGAGRVVRLVFPSGQVFAFETDDRDEALTAIARGREEAKGLRDEDDPRITWMFRLDPLQRPRVSGVLGPRAPLAAQLAPWTERAWVVAPIAAIVLAPPLRGVRDLASDAKMYAAATRGGDAPSLRSYLDRGGRRSPEVASILLPRAELREAEREGSVEAVDAFIASHPGVAIPDEVSAARRRALLRALERAEKEGTVAALHAFAKKWPDHGLEPELRDAMHGLFVPALEAYRKKPLGPTPVRSFVERLFAWSEAKAHAGSEATTIKIRFRRAPSPTMRRADKMVADHHWFIGEASYPSRYFDAAHAAPREKQVGEILAKRVKEVFGPTVFTVELGDRLEDGTGELPAVTEPTLFVTHEQEWSGRFDGSITKPRGVWVGVNFRFHAEFLIPGDKSPLTFDYEVVEPIPLSIIRENPAGGSPGSPLEEKIYGKMADDAFKRFEEKYLATFLPGT
jgi:hypothetical protein